MSENDDYYTVSGFPIVEKLLKKVLFWRNEKEIWNNRYLGITNTSKELLKYWFGNDLEQKTILKRIKNNGKFIIT